MTSLNVGPVSLRAGLNDRFDGIPLKTVIDVKISRPVISKREKKNDNNNIPADLSTAF